MRQASRITWLRGGGGDANTKNFSAKINSRRRKNFIAALKTNEGVVTAHEDKEDCIFEHFNSLLGSKQDCSK